MEIMEWLFQHYAGILKTNNQGKLTDIHISQKEIQDKLVHSYITT